MMDWKINNRELIKEYSMEKTYDEIKRENDELEIKNKSLYNALNDLGKGVYESEKEYDFMPNCINVPFQKAKEVMITYLGNLQDG